MSEKTAPPRLDLESSELSVLESRFRGLLDHSPDGITIKDAAGHYLLCNSRFCEWMGLEPNEILGRTVGELLDVEHGVAAVEAQDRQVIRERRAVRALRDMSTLRSAACTVDVVKFPIFDDAGEIIGIGTIGRDVTEALARERELAEKEQRYRAFISDTSEAVWHLRFEPPIPTDLPALEQARLICERGVFVECNAMFAATYAYPSAESIIGQRYLDAVPPGNDGFLDFWSRFAEEGYRFVSRSSSKLGLDGERRCFVKNGHGVVEDGALVGAWGTERDVTEQREAERKLLESERRFRVLYDETPSMYFTLTPQGRIRSVNRLGAEQLGYRPEELADTALTELHAEDDRAAILGHIARCAEHSDETHRWEIRKRRRDGTVFWVRETARAVADADGALSVLSVCEDTSEARALSRELSYQATHDPLTGIVNRREFERRLERVIETARAEGSAHALCYLDLDQFKLVNDTCGHAAGDDLLRQLSAALASRVRDRDTLARLGGDEFGVLVERCPLEHAERIARELVDAIQDFRFRSSGQSFSIGASVGVVPVDGSGDLSSVLAAADAACYAAKEQGRNMIHVYHPDDEELKRRHGEVQWIVGLTGAIDGDRLRLARQPIVPISGAAPAGACLELLVRLEDERGDLVLPGAFLPAAERYRLCPRLDRWVVENAICWMSRDADRLGNLSHCSVNLSGQSIGDESFLAFVLSLLERDAAIGPKLCFEITETAAIANLSAAMRFIEGLRARGVNFALDDFGTGLSSFAYLKNLDVDYLKIDGQFVKDMAEDPIDFAMVKSINEIAHVLGKRTIAEFVESDAILAQLRGIGVDYAQGFGVGRPALIDHRA